jgi:CDP-diacylglycerol--glycerol-3-phosphate 3-phosphatidyltransferase
MTTGLYTIKPWFVRRLARVEDLLVTRNVGADSLTIAAVAVSLVAGSAIGLGSLLEMPILWAAVAPLGLIRLALNALDGSVARRSGTARPFGLALNELCDRLSDAALIASLGFVVPWWAVGAALTGAFLASTSGIVAAVVTGHRDTSGPMGKADRVAVLSVGAVVAGLTGSEPSFLVAALVIAVGATITALLRILRLREV